MWTNILEHPAEGDESSVSWRKGDEGGKIGIDLRFRPFEIKTLKLVLA